MIVVLVLLVAYVASKGTKSKPRASHPVTFSPQIKRAALVPPRVTTEIDPFNGRFTPFS